MAVYAITGKLGGGKGKGAVMKAREYLRAGKRVAGNIDLFMEHLVDDRSKESYTRLPDKPSATDLYMMGSGNRFIDFKPHLVMEKGIWKAFAPDTSRSLLPGFDEAYNGALFLDECGSWLNTRSYAEKGRTDLLEWMIHARKYGWDVYFIMQNISQVDKQLREAMFEYVVRFTRLDKLRVPVVSDLVKGLSAGALNGNLPRLHVGVVRLGSSPDALVADRWMFRGDDLQKAYNTTQVFSDTYPHETHCLLSAWHLSAKVGIPRDFVGPIRPGPLDLVLLQGRTQPLKPPHPHMTKFLVISLLLGLAIGVGGSYFFGIGQPQAVAESSVKAPATGEPKKPPVALGFLRSAGDVSVILQDGRVVVPTEFTTNADGTWRAVIDGGVTVTGDRP